jgi:epoxyqueuosine reductase QueG
MNRTIENELTARGAKQIRFVDVSHLSREQNRGLPNAVVFALPLTPAYIQEVIDTPDYVAARVADNFRFDDDEYLKTEIRAGKIADELAELLVGKGYRALSQSDDSLLSEGLFDAETHTSILPNKPLAVLGGMGWIGKNNLLITPEYGAAQCLGTVLTDVPLETMRHEIIAPKCGDCTVCVKICERQVLKNRVWTPTMGRDEIVDVYGCSTCLKCLVHCPRTRKLLK